MPKKVSSRTPDEDAKAAAPGRTAKNKLAAVCQIRDQLRAEGVADPKPLDVYERFQGMGWSTGDKKKDVNYITRILSQLGRKERGAPAPRPSEGGPITVDDMTAVLAEAEALGQDIHYIIRQMDQLGPLADKAGGFDRLRKTLQAIARIRGAEA